MEKMSIVTSVNTMFGTKPLLVPQQCPVCGSDDIHIVVHGATIWCASEDSHGRFNCDWAMSLNTGERINRVLEDDVEDDE